MDTGKKVKQVKGGKASFSCGSSDSGTPGKATRRGAGSAVKGGVKKGGGAKKSAALPDRRRDDTYTVAKGKAICENIEARGMSLKAAAEAAGVKHPTAHLWLRNRKEFADNYARATHGITGWGEELLRLCELLREITEEPERFENANYAIQALRVEIDTRKWILSRLVPRYRDHAALELRGRRVGRWRWFQRWGQRPRLGWRGFWRGWTR